MQSNLTNPTLGIIAPRRLLLLCFGVLIVMGWLTTGSTVLDTILVGLILATGEYFSGIISRPFAFRVRHNDLPFEGISAGNTREQDRSFSRKEKALGQGENVLNIKIRPLVRISLERATLRIVNRGWFPTIFNYNYDDPAFKITDVRVFNHRNIPLPSGAYTVTGDDLCGGVLIEFDPPLQRSAFNMEVSVFVENDWIYVGNLSFSAPWGKIGWITRGYFPVRIN